MVQRVGLIGLDSSHAEDFLRLLNIDQRWPGIEVTAIFGGDRARNDELVGISQQARPASSIEELVARVDAVIVGARDGRLHLQHALPALQAGKPVFVDKPLACSLADAEAMVLAAERNGAPLLSGSALRWQRATQDMKARVAQLNGAPGEVAAYGTWYPQSEYGGPIFYAIHTIELAQELAGPDWRELTLEEAETPVLGYWAGSTRVTLNFLPAGAGASDFGVTLVAAGDTIHQPIMLEEDYMAPVLDEIAAMWSAGRSPLSHDHLLAPIALMEEAERLLRVRARDLRA